MRFSIGLPPNLSFQTYARLAALVERHDFSLLVVDDIPNFKSCWGILFFLARETRRVQLGPSVTHPYQRHPLVTVANVAALDELTGGRAFLGWGRGDAGDHRAMHLDMPRPLRAVREAVALSRRLLAGSQAAFAGEVFRLEPNFGFPFRPRRADLRSASPGRTLERGPECGQHLGAAPWARRPPTQRRARSISPGPAGTLCGTWTPP